MSDTPMTKEELQGLRSEVEALRKEVAQLKKATPEISEETLSIIAAAVAAYLGERATVHFVRRIGEEDPWLAHGRATVVAQHKLPSTRGW
jgi:hypothetical protein